MCFNKNKTLTLEGLLQKSQDIQNVVSLISLAKKDPKHVLIQQILAKCAKIKKNVTETKDILKRQNKKYEEMKEMQESVEKNIKLFDQVVQEYAAGEGKCLNEESVEKINKIGTIIKKLSNIYDTEERLSETQQSNELSEANSPKPTHHVSSASDKNFDSYKSVESINTQLKSKVKIKGIALLYDFDYINEGDLKLVPGYMLGRITLSQINTFIDKINETIQAKSEMLKKKSKLTYNEKKLMVLYKIVKSIKSQHFISEEHLLEIMSQKCMDKKSMQYIMVLKHLKKLDIHKESNNKYYILF